jgi:hypothetical protein
VGNSLQLSYFLDKTRTEPAASVIGLTVLSNPRRKAQARAANFPSVQVAPNHPDFVDENFGG